MKREKKKCEKAWRKGSDDKNGRKRGRRKKYTVRIESTTEELVDKCKVVFA
jgi:hypothetical protein